MEKTFFVLYGAGDADVTAAAMTITEIVQGAKKFREAFEPLEYATQEAALNAAEKVWMSRYKVFGLYDYDLSGMNEFLCEAHAAGELVHLSALEVAQNFAEAAQRILRSMFTEAQKTAMARVRFPVAWDTRGFEKYQAQIAEIRGKSIAALYEYVKNGDETPE